MKATVSKFHLSFLYGLFCPELFLGPFSFKGAGPEILEELRREIVGVSDSVSYEEESEYCRSLSLAVD